MAIEQAWYALHIAKDPQAPNRSTMWLCRHDDDASKAKCKSEFSVQRVRSTHEALDPITADLLHQLYETTIDFGAHPNQRGLLSSMQRADTQTDTTYQGIMGDVPVFVAFPGMVGLEELRWGVRRRGRCGFSGFATYRPCLPDLVRSHATSLPGAPRRRRKVPDTRAEPRA